MSAELLSINVNAKTEKKNGLSYLSWAWAWAEVLKIDPQADWEAVEYAQPDGTTSPCIYCGGGSAMVKTRVTIKGKTRVCQLPVMDHRNKAIKDPDAFAINTAIMRCMTKAISMHGLGLYIYAGEDVPEADGDLTDKLEASIALEKSKKGPGVIKGTDGIENQIDPERRAELDELALYLIELNTEGRGMEAVAAYYGIEDNDSKVYVWKCLQAESKLRAFLKANSPHKVVA